MILQDLENKGDDLQDLKNAGVMVYLELWGDTNLRLVDSVSTKLIIHRGVKVFAVGN